MTILKDLSYIKNEVSEPVINALCLIESSANFNRSSDEQYIYNFDKHFHIDPQLTQHVLSVLEMIGEVEYKEWTKKEHTKYMKTHNIHINEETGEYIEQPLDEYYSPTNNQHTATSTKQLKKLCSDNSRHIKGDTGYILDFMMDGSLSKTESKIILYLCKKIIVWNYATTTLQEIQNISGLTSARQTKNVWNSLCEKKMIVIVNDKFDDYGHTCILIQIHPKIYWKGRFSAWAIHANNSINTSQYLSESYE